MFLVQKTASAAALCMTFSAHFLIFSRLAPFVTSFIGSVLINKIFLKTPNLINLDFILIFISLYLVLYVFISHTKSLCEQLAIVNQKINSHSDEQ